MIYSFPVMLFGLYNTGFSDLNVVFFASERYTNEWIQKFKARRKSPYVV